MDKNKEILDKLNDEFPENDLNPLTMKEVNFNEWRVPDLKDFWLELDKGYIQKQINQRFWNLF